MFLSDVFHGRRRLAEEALCVLGKPCGITAREHA
jgi:hypothetical protein